MHTPIRLPALGLLALAAAARAHFVLQIPTSLGYDDERLVESPCGSFDPRDRSKGVADWPVGGHPVSVISTHGNVEWEVNAALVTDGAPLRWEPLAAPFRQRGVGFVCFEVVPGHPEWIGREAVVQIVQHAVDGDLHQCAAVRFVAGGPAGVPGDCENTAGVSHDPIVAPQRPTSQPTSPPPEPTTTSGETSAPPPPPPTPTTTGKDGTSAPPPPPPSPTTTTTSPTTVETSTSTTSRPTSEGSSGSGGHGGHGSSTTTGGHGHGHGSSSTATTTAPTGTGGMTVPTSSPSVPTAGTGVLAPWSLVVAGVAALAAAGSWVL